MITNKKGFEEIAQGNGGWTVKNYNGRKIRSDVFDFISNIENIIVDNIFDFEQSKSLSKKRIKNHSIENFIASSISSGIIELTVVTLNDDECYQLYNTIAKLLDEVSKIDYSESSQRSLRVLQLKFYDSIPESTKSKISNTESIKMYKYSRENSTSYLPKGIHRFIRNIVVIPLLIGITSGIVFSEHDSYIISNGNKVQVSNYRYEKENIVAGSKTFYNYEAAILSALAVSCILFMIRRKKP
jgi:hypothetical protein